MDSHKRNFQADATKCLFDELIDRHAEAYMNVYPEVTEFSNFEMSGTGNYYIGMVWMKNKEKPDLQQLRIRGSQSIADNRLVELNLSAVDSQQSFFPGQIIAFKANPFTGRQLSVRTILDPMRIAPRMKSINTDAPIRLLLASGPFMKPEQQDWTLYDKIIENIKSQEATHVVLIGPFVDLENKAIRSNYDVNWKLCFDKLVEGLIDHTCQVFLVPSSRDVLPSYISATYFYPSPKLDFDFQLKEGVKPKCNIISVTDPAQIDLGGIYLDVTSAEVLFHLNMCSSFMNKGGNTFTSMYRHILSHGIYPIYPPPTDIAVDFPKLARFTQLDRLGPHILVLPTRFNTTVGNVDNRLVVTIQKCSTKKQVVVVDIPKIESSLQAPMDSIVITDYSHRIVNLVSPKELGEGSTPRKAIEYLATPECAS